MVRNPLILKTLFKSEDVESYSSGFKRVYDECNSNGVNIDYIINREGFTFIFKRNVLNNVVNKELSEEERLVLGIIKKDPSTSAKKIGEIINKSERSIQRMLSDLKQKRIIERIGNTKGYWKINE